MDSWIWQRNISQRRQFGESSHLRKMSKWQRNIETKEKTATMEWHQHIFGWKFFFARSTPPLLNAVCKTKRQTCNWKYQFVLFKNVFTALNKEKKNRNVCCNIFGTYKNVCLTGLFMCAYDAEKQVVDRVTWHRTPKGLNKRYAGASSVHVCLSIESSLILKALHHISVLLWPVYETRTLTSLSRPCSPHCTHIFMWSQFVKMQCESYHCVGYVSLC